MFRLRYVEGGGGGGSEVGVNVMSVCVGRVRGKRGGRNK